MKDDNTKTAFAIFLVVLGGIAFVPLYCMWVGYAFSVLWGWFVVPALGLPALSLANAIGICIIVGLLKYKHHEKTDGDGTRMIYQTLSPAFSLGVGWIVKAYFA